MLIHRLIRRFTYFRPADEGADLGAAPAATPSEAPAASSEAAPAPAAPAEPSTMLEAIERHFHRDEAGRFASPPAADGEQPAAAAAKPAEQAAQTKPAAPAAPPQPGAEDMPEGLGQKAQERFRALSAQVKEGQQQIEQLSQQVQHVREVFQSNGITQDQFTQATEFLGAVNRGDLQTAERVLLGQLKQLSLLTGKTYGPAVDALADFPDLRQRVDGLQISEADAIEMARHRQAQAALQRQQQEQHSAMQAQQQQRQAAQQATAAVDQWWQQTAAADIDAPAIEAQLLPHVQTLLRGLPPQQWVPALQAQYQILKGAIGELRKTTAQPAAQPAALRPTGSGSAPQQRPGSMYEAMWGQ